MIEPIVVKIHSINIFMKHQTNVFFWEKIETIKSERTSDGICPVDNTLLVIVKKTELIAASENGLLD